MSFPLTPYPSQMSWYGSQPFTNTGIGFNRRTYRAGQTIGRAIKKWWDNRRVSQSTKREAKKTQRRKNKTRRPFKAAAIEHEPQGNASASNFIPHKTYNPRGPMNKFAPQHYTINNAFRLAAGLGLQQSTSSPMGTPTDLAVCAAKYLAIAPGALLPTGRMFLEAMTTEFLINNQSNVTLTLTVRDLMSRRDIPNIAGIANPETCWNTGLVDELATGLASDYGVKPYESDIFNQFYKIVKESKVDINPGGNFRYHVKTKPNQFVHQEVLNNVTNGLRNLTVWTMFTIQGFPVHDSTTKTTITSGSISVDIVFNRTYEFCFASANNVSYTRANGLAGTLAVGEETMNEELGELQNAAGLSATIGAF